MKYTRNRHEIGHHSSQSNPILVRVRYWQVFATYILLAPRVARKHGLVQARAPRLTVVFLTFVLAQRGGGNNTLREQLAYSLSFYGTPPGTFLRFCGIFVSGVGVHCMVVSLLVGWGYIACSLGVPLRGFAVRWGVGGGGLWYI